MTPLEVVHEQLEAYNARDLGRFLRTYAETVTLYRMPNATTPALAGRAQLEAFYASERFNRPALHAELLNRMVLGNKVFDHERIHGVREQPFEAVVTYEVLEGTIQNVWMFSGDG